MCFTHECLTAIDAGVKGADLGLDQLRFWMTVSARIEEGRNAEVVTDPDQSRALAGYDVA